MPQSDYTHYRLFNIPSDVIIEVDGTPAVENIWYLNTLDIIAKKNLSSDYGEPYATITYQTTDGTVESQKIPLKINLQVDSGTPSSSSKELIVLNDSDTNLDIQSDINDSTDRIKIVSFDPTGQFFIGDSLVSAGQEILRKDLINLDFVAGAVGFGDNYNDIKYLVGNKNGYEVTEYTTTIKIIGQASLTLESEQTGIDYDYIDYSLYTYRLKIGNGIPEGVINLDMLIAFNGGQIATYIETSITNIQYVNGTYNLTPSLNAENGELEFAILVQVDNGDKPETGSITLTLNDIDGDPGNVSGANVVIINLNLT